MNKAMKMLRKYQYDNFMTRTLSNSFDGFDHRAYPETATGINLDSIGRAIKILPRYYKNEKWESCESFRKRILLFLETPDSEGEGKRAA